MFFIILYNVYLKEINNKKGYWRFVKYFMGISIFIILYAKITFNGTIKSSLFVIITASIYFSYNYIKRNYPRNMKYFILTLSMGFIFFFLIGHKIWTAMDSKLIFNPIWIGYLFNPQINIPMQWFSSLIAPPFFLISLFFIPLLFKGKEFKLFYLVFMSNLALFVFKYNGTYFHARYIYYFFFLYIIIFSGSFYYFFKIYSKKIKLQFFPRLLTILFCIFLFLFLFNNSFIAANHQNNVDYPRYDTNQPTFSGNRNYYFDDYFAWLPKIVERDYITPYKLIKNLLERNGLYYALPEKVCMRFVEISLPVLYFNKTKTQGELNNEYPRIDRCRIS